MPLEPLDPVTRTVVDRWLAYEADVARHVADRRAARLAGRVALRGRLAALLHRAADRLEPRAAPAPKAVPR